MKKTSKRKAMVSLVSAAMMLSTTVFASGSLTDFVADDYTVLFSNNEVGNESFEFQNKAFVHNTEVYVPLREAFEVLGVLSNTDSNITWNNGEIDLCVAYEGTPITADTPNGKQTVKSLTYLYNYKVKIGSTELTINSAPTALGQDISNTKAMNNAPILKENVTYIPFSYIDCILNSTKHWAVNYSIYDKDKNLITASLYPIDDKTARTTISNYEDKTEKCCEKTEQFFAAFEKGDINNMKNYCTKDFVNDYFHNERFLSMTSGTLKTIYSIRAFSNGDYYVHLKMSSDDLADKEGIYYAVFEEQPDGKFLLKAFQDSYYDEL